MSTLVAADLLKVRRRRGLWWSALLLPSAAVAIVFVLGAAGVSGIGRGASFVSDQSGVVFVVGGVLAILVGARLGADEHAAGTLRYQLLTGIPRHRLLLSKLAVLGLVCVAISAAGAASATLGGLLLAAPPGNGVTAGDVVDAFWNPLVASLVYGSISFGIGSVVRSTGPAIATALVLNLIGVQIAGVLTLIDEWLIHVVLPVGIDRLTFDDVTGSDRLGILAAIIVTIAWPGMFVGAGWLRLRRLEA